MKVEENMVLVLQFGKPHKKQSWSILMSDFVLEAGKSLKLSNTQIKRLLKQGGISIRIYKYEKEKTI